MKAGMTLLSKCPKCGQSNGHSSDCVYGKIERLESKARHIACPNCRKNTVGLNADDFWECRECHTQYTSSPATADSDDCVEKLLVIDLNAPIHQGCQRVLELKTKGEGNFPLDHEIEELRKQTTQ